MKLTISTLLGLLVLGATAAYAVQAESPKMNGTLRVTTLSPDEVRYTGKPYNKELDAYVFNARNYDPHIIRWTTSDPSGFPDTPNNRTYSFNAPTNFVDASGLSPVAAGNGYYYFTDDNEFDPNAALGYVVTNPNPNYCGQCATTAEYLAGGNHNGSYYDTPSAGTWVQGGAVNSSTPIGTMIAMGWQDGGYPNLSPGAYNAQYPGDNVNHTGIFEGYNSDGTIMVMQASKGQPIAIGNFDPNTTDWSTVLSKQQWDSSPSNSSLVRNDPNHPCCE